MPLSLSLLSLEAGEIAEDMPGSLADVLVETSHDDEERPSGPDAMLDSFKGSWVISSTIQVSSVLCCESPIFSCGCCTYRVE